MRGYFGPRYSGATENVRISEHLKRVSGKPVRLRVISAERVPFTWGCAAHAHYSLSRP